MGYYPAPLEAVALAASYLRPPRAPFAMLDPCAGEGAALGQLATILGCASDHVHGIELDESRADKLKANLPNARILAPAAFEGCAANHQSFGFIWLNPPFDAAYDGGRVEADFLNRAIEWLMPGGVLALVCPASQVDDSWQPVPRKFTAWFHDVQVVPFPEEHRPYDEVIVFGVRNESPLVYGPRWESLQAKPGTVYKIPTGRAPRMFKKVQPTEAEFQRALKASPLRRLWNITPAPVIPSPPLAIGMGHVALLLASGHLDGLVNPPDGARHVVRGTSRKEKYQASKTENESADGGSTTKTVISERIELIVKTIGPDGIIREFSNTKEKANGTA